MSKLVLFLFFWSTISDVTCDCNKKKTSTSLAIRDNIFCNYDNTVRPVINHGQAMNITMYLGLRYFDYDPHTYILSVDAWLPMMWKDEHLSWDPSDYGGIYELHVSSSEIWTPDISLYNKGDFSVGPKLYENADCIVQFDGRITCMPIVEMDGLCVPDLTYWPYDTQTCKMKIGSWIHRGEEIDFSPGLMSDNYTPNSEWALLNMSVQRDPGVFAGLNNSYPSMVYTFEIKRHSSAQAAIVVSPALAVTMMTLLTSWLDPISKDRIYLSALNVPCHFLLLQHVAWEVPLNGDTVANIILFFRDSLLITAAVLIETVIVRGILGIEKESPTFLVSVFNMMGQNRFGKMLLVEEEVLGRSSGGDSNKFDVVHLQEPEGGNQQDDGANLVDISNVTGRKQWMLLGKSLDRIFFIGCLTVYTVLVLCYLPK